eukprot:4254799-Prymnesium_polylepis.1
MQKESVRSDQTRAHNDAGIPPSLTGRGIGANWSASLCPTESLWWSRLLQYGTHGLAELAPV